MGEFWIGLDYAKETTKKSEKGDRGRPGLGSNWVMEERKDTEAVRFQWLLC